jgi:hypothetical protein
MSYKEGSESYAESMGKKYLVDDLISLAENSPTYDVSIDEVDWVLEYAKPDEVRILKADLTVPVIVTEERVSGKNRLVVLDGLHRLAKAKRLGKKTIRAKFLTQKELRKIQK